MNARQEPRLGTCCAAVGLCLAPNRVFGLASSLFASASDALFSPIAAADQEKREELNGLAASGPAVQLVVALPVASLFMRWLAPPLPLVDRSGPRPIACGGAMRLLRGVDLRLLRTARAASDRGWDGD